jgi:hypothetical protein
MAIAAAESVRQSRKPGALPEALVIVALVVASLVFLLLFNNILRTYYKHVGSYSGLLAALPFLVTAAGAMLFARERYTQFVPLLRIALRSSGIGLLVYLLIEPPDFTLAVTDFHGQARYVHMAYYAAVGLAAASIFAPAFIVPVAIYIISARRLIDGISGLPSSLLDVHYMLDMAVYLTVFGLVGRRLVGSRLSLWASGERQQEIALIAFGLHLGNYFWSGIAKLLVGPYFWTWVIENRTHNLIPYALEKGALPIGHIPWLTQFAYDTTEFAITPVNIAIVAVQLFAIICVLRLLWLKVATILYDVLHVGIYVLSGILFWPWIWNNFTILLAARTQRAEISKQAQMACILTILLSNPHFGLYKAAWLAWFDVADARQLYVEAVTDQGRATVPPSFFLSHSFSVSLGYMDTSSHEGQYDHTNWNAARPYARQASSGTCPPPSPDRARVDTAEMRTARLERIHRFLRAHHAKMLEREATFGKHTYYFRMHHHPSNPYLFPKFGSLNLADVRAYDLVLESVCHDIQNGRVIKRVVGRTVEHFDVR